MEISQVKAKVEQEYDLNIDHIIKIKNVYKIQCADKIYCLKVIKYELGHFWFIVSAMEHLQNRGFQKVPYIILNICNKEFIKLENSYAYLTEWVKARECNYDNPIDVMLATKKLAELHIKSEGFCVKPNMNPRIGWLKWPQIFCTRRNEILDFKKRIENKDVKTEFDIMYLNAMEEELERAEAAVDNLMDADYVMKMKEEIVNRGFCHHDYAHHNVLIDEEENISIIDFDYCILDTHLHDLSSLLLRRMKNGKWDMESAEFILSNYDLINSVYQDDIPIMASFMEFPQDFWQVGIQYYWEKQPWGEEFFVNKLLKICQDKDEKQEFINEFRYMKID